MIKRFLLLIGILLLVVLGSLGFKTFLDRHNNKELVPALETSKTSQTNIPAFNKNLYSISDTTSIWLVVNKLRPLNPKSYAPTDLLFPNVSLRVPGDQSMKLRAEVAKALLPMFEAAKTAGSPLMLSSGYRSFNDQTALYNSYVAKDGKAQADTYSARPGYSEHQTGLSADIEPEDGQCNVEQCFADLPAGKWLAANAYKYGFIVRYPKDKTLITGYEYEPWHIRYVGKPLAKQMHTQKIETLEEFFNLPAAPNYPTTLDN